jgi:peptidoglycan hydrolase CwlO-like protein
MRRLFVLISLALIFASFFKNGSLKTSFLQEQTDEQKKNEIQKKIDEYEKKLSEVRNQKNTLSSQIEYMDTQIYLTGLRAEDTKEKIEKTQYEIETLDAWIKNLDNSLDKLSETLLSRIVAGYKTRQASVIDVMFDSSNANEMVNKLKYYQIARERNKKVLMEVQEAKLNYEEQKKLREKKKTELDQLQKQLLAQQDDLKVQQESKRTLLQVTQSDEATYSRLLEEAKRQITAYKTFVQTTGVGTISANGLGTGECSSYWWGERSGRISFGAASKWGTIFCFSGDWNE